MGIHYIESTPLIPVSTVKPSNALDACEPPGPLVVWLVAKTIIFSYIVFSGYWLPCLDPSKQSSEYCI